MFRVDKDGVTGWDPKLEMLLRRFERITDNDADIKKFRKLMRKRRLTGYDLRTIFKVLRVRPGNEHTL